MAITKDDAVRRYPWSRYIFRHRHFNEEESRRIKERLGDGARDELIGYHVVTRHPRYDWQTGLRGQSIPSSRILELQRHRRTWMAIDNPCESALQPAWIGKKFSAIQPARGMSSRFRLLKGHGVLYAPLHVIIRIR